MLAQLPELEARKRGRDILLVFHKDVRSILSQASDYSEAIILTKAAKILLRHMQNAADTMSRHRELKEHASRKWTS